MINYFHCRKDFIVLLLRLIQFNRAISKINLNEKNIESKLLSIYKEHITK